MILVLVNSSRDNPTVRVIDWLDYLGASYTVVSGMDFLSGGYDVCKRIGEDAGFGIDVGSVNVVWSRRWFSSLSFPLPISSGWLKQKVRQNLQREYATLSNYFFHTLKNAYWIPSRQAMNVNKPAVLEEARELGFSIPATLVAKRKSDVADFLNLHGKIICKPVDNLDIFINRREQSVFTTYTTLITDAFLEGLPERFFPSLFQQYIEKALEYRVFFIEGEVYATAIVPTGVQPLVDSRAGDKEEVRYEPAMLPASVVERIRKLMRKLGLNTGSIDFILSRTGEFYFLEVNPVGQFSGYSDHCNYGLERRVAEILMAKDNE